MQTPEIMCRGAGCPIKDYCFRHTAQPMPDQKYYVKSPWVQIEDSDINRKSPRSYCTSSWILGDKRQGFIKLSDQLKNEG